MRWTAAQLAAYEARRATPPTHRREAKPMRQVLEASEAQIHEAVVEHLRARCRPGVHWHHPATGELRDPGTARKLQRMGARAGLPDLLVLIDGRLHGLELKRERGGRLSPDQKAMHEELTAAGAVIATAWGVDEAIATLAQWRAFREEPTNGRQIPREHDGVPAV